MSGSIPASQIVSVLPSVLSAGGNGLVMNGVMLTTNPRFPIGSVLSFPTSDAVGSYAGATSVDAAWAKVYFGGFTNADQLPGQLLVTQYPLSAVAAWLRGGSVAGLTLSQLQALSGVLTITVDGTSTTSSNISLSAATSPSNAATIIQAAFTSPGFAVTYDSVSGAFVFTNATTGGTSTLTFASGSLAAGLSLTQATGAVLSQGADAAVPGTFMTTLTKLTQNWATFSHNFDPDNGSGNTQKLLFAQWNSTQNSRWGYIPWDADVTPTESNAATTSLGYICKTTPLGGTIPVYDPSNEGLAPFAMSWAACLDFTALNGAATLAFKSQEGLGATVTDPTIAANLLANGYNFYGAYATANQLFTWFQNGQISGQYLWADAYVYQIWLTNAFQLALMELLKTLKSIPYNSVGYGAVEGALYSGGGTNSSQMAGPNAAPSGPIQQALDFGIITPGISLAATQIQSVNSSAGKDIATTIQSRGWYLQVLDPGPQSRAARTTPACKFWYNQGGSIQQITLSSIELQ